MKRAMAIGLVVALCLGMAAFAVADTGQPPPIGGCTCASDATCCTTYGCGRSAGQPCKCVVEVILLEKDTMTPDYKYLEYKLKGDTLVYSGSVGDNVETTLSAGTDVLLGTKIFDRLEILYNDEQNAGFIDADLERMKTEAAVKNKENTKDGWTYENGLWYFYQDDRKKTGWVKTTEGNDIPGGQWYYLDAETGALQTGWVKTTEGNDNLGGLWYYLRPEWGGALLEGGWLWSEEYQAWFYLQSELGGAMATDQWIFTDGNWCYVGPDGAMLRNTHTPDGNWVDESGKRIAQ